MSRVLKMNGGLTYIPNHSTFCGTIVLKVSCQTIRWLENRLKLHIQMSLLTSFQKTCRTSAPVIWTAGSQTATLKQLRILHKIYISGSPNRQSDFVKKYLYSPDACLITNHFWCINEARTTQKWTNETKRGPIKSTNCRSTRRIYRINFMKLLLEGLIFF